MFEMIFSVLIVFCQHASYVVCRVLQCVRLLCFSTRLICCVRCISMCGDHATLTCVTCCLQCNSIRADRVLSTLFSQRGWYAACSKSLNWVLIVFFHDVWKWVLNWADQFLSTSFSVCWSGSFNTFVSCLHRGTLIISTANVWYIICSTLPRCWNNR